MNSLETMRASVFFEGDDAPRRYSRFWMLIVLASVIASAGVVGDSTATVIGAMIVAPLMTPILGVVLATVIGDRRNLARCWILVIAGAATAALIGYLIGLAVPSPVVAETNSQVAARVSPHLIDMLAALATGAVGAIALIRKDISDTLPGVAIAISLVPPLSVVGLTLEAGAGQQALGALLLFVTNVAAILATGVVVLIVFRVVDRAPAATRSASWARRNRPLISIIVSLLVIGIPLTATSLSLAQQSRLESGIVSAATPWAEENGWEVAGVTVSSGSGHLMLTGEPPEPDTADLVEALRKAGVDPASVTVEFVPVNEVRLSETPS